MSKKKETTYLSDESTVYIYLMNITSHETYQSLLIKKQAPDPIGTNRMPTNSS